LVGDLLLTDALGQQRLQGFVVGHIKESLDPQQRSKRPQGDVLLLPEGGIPGDVAGGFTLGRIHQHPLVAVGHQAQPHITGVQQFHHPRRRTGSPARALYRLFQGLGGRVKLNQEAGFTCPLKTLTPSPSPRTGEGSRRSFLFPLVGIGG
jgi:hypothetical protein